MEPKILHVIARMNVGGTARYVSTLIENIDKVEFINTCDAMLHARIDGETFGLAIAEFSLKNKPVLCTDVGDIAHMMLLKEKAVYYNSTESLKKLLCSFQKEMYEGKDWNAYREFTPEKVLRLFESLIEKHSLRF